MKKLLLTSAGFYNPKVGQEFLKLVEKPASEIRVIFVPTAACTKEELYEINVSKKELKELNVKEVKVFDLDHRINWREVMDYDVIYVCGGNTFYLLKKVKESGFDKIIKRFLTKGGLYVGVGAGSHIACPTIETVAWKNPDRNIIELTDLTALNLIPFLLSMHYELKCKTSVDKAIASTRYEVKRFTDSQALLVTGKGMRRIE